MIRLSGYQISSLSDHYIFSLSVFGNTRLSGYHIIRLSDSYMDRLSDDQFATLSDHIRFYQIISWPGCQIIGLVYYQHIRIFRVSGYQTMDDQMAK